MRNTIKNISFIFLIICVTGISYHPSQAREISGTKGSKIFGEIISTFDQPWAISFINSNTMLVTTKGGMLWLVDSSGFKKSIANIPKVSVGGQGGLGDVIIHPDLLLIILFIYLMSHPMTLGFQNLPKLLGQS